MMAFRMLVNFLLARSPTMSLKQMTPYYALERVIVAPTLQAEWFADTFLFRIPLANVAQRLDQVKTELGAYQSIQPEGENFQGENFQVLYERGKQLAEVKINELGQINYFVLKSEPLPVTPEEAIEKLKDFPGRTNLLILDEDNLPIAAHGADLALGVASTFKLAVLAALQEKIKNGTLSWTDVVVLRPEDKSVGGFLVNWFDGAVFTVESLAALMISVSENTATDILMNLMGRDPIAPYAPRMFPLLTTREIFVLKSPTNENLLRRFRSGNSTNRAQVLEEVKSAPRPDAKLFPNKPIALDLDYFFTPYELCALMSKVADLPLMIINPGLSAKSAINWDRVAFKGGSLPGVLNITLQLKSKNGKTYRLSATWNDPSAVLDEAVFIDLIDLVVAGLLSR